MIAVVVGGLCLLAGVVVVVAVVWIKERRRTAASRDEAWADIARDVPGGTTIATVESGGAAAWIEIGPSHPAVGESR
jgi:hypothetical protein